MITLGSRGAIQSFPCTSTIYAVSEGSTPLMLYIILVMDEMLVHFTLVWAQSKVAFYHDTIECGADVQYYVIRW